MSSDSPPERELLQQILWRLKRIEERLNIDPWKSSIGYDNDGPPLPLSVHWSRSTTFSQVPASLRSWTFRS